MFIIKFKCKHGLICKAKARVNFKYEELTM